MTTPSASTTPSANGPTVIGLTGGIGVGKSTAAAILGELGAIVVDCDQLGRDVVTSQGRAFSALVERFGPEIVGTDGELDRPALAGIVFNNAEALADLNAITHPAIDIEIEQVLGEAPRTATVVLDMAVLVESNLGAGQYQQVLVIESPLQQRLDRLFEQRKMDPDDAHARIASQATDEERRAVADHVIANDSDHDALRRALKTWWNNIHPSP